MEGGREGEARTVVGVINSNEWLRSKAGISIQVT